MENSSVDGGERLCPPEAALRVPVEYSVKTNAALPTIKSALSHPLPLAGSVASAAQKTDQSCL